MRRIIIVPVVLLLETATALAQNDAGTFKADRNFLFKQCAVLTNYEMDGDKAVPRGRTVLSDA
jgi:hypothetical protein